MPEEFDPENLENLPEDEIAGGPAIKPKPNFGKPGGVVDGMKKIITDKAIDSLTGGGWEAAKRIPVIGKYLDELKNKAVKMASKQFWKALLAANWPTFTTIAVIVILLLITIIPAFGGISRARKGFYGKTPANNVAYANAEDRSLINELSMLANGGSTLDLKKIGELAQKILDKLNSGDMTFSKKTEAIAALTQIISLCNTSTISSDATKMIQISTLIKNVISFYNSNPIGLKGSFVSPAAGENIISFNNTLHGRSVMRPSNISGHNVFHGFTNPGLGDAVDIKLGHGKPVKAMFDGTLTTNGSSGRYKCAILTSDSSYANKIEAWYCHVDSVASAGHYKAGDRIANVMSSGTIQHTHFEVWVDGKSIHTTPEDVSKGGVMGTYMWQHIRDAFGFK